MRAVVVASGDLDPSDLRRLDDVQLVVAADGGATGLDRAGRRVDILVGDLDSVDPGLVDRLAAAGTSIERHPIDKDASDTELALEAALGRGATQITVLGALGGDRLDHELANILLLADAAMGPHVRLVRSGTTVRSVGDGRELEIEAPPGSTVTLLPIGGEASGVTACGLRWPLEAATLRIGRSRGLSNVVTEAGASVRVGRGTLLVVETESTGATA